MVGLASMLAKWMRERLMKQFNSYWAEQVPGIEPTAGYPGDAPRFYELIKDKVAALGLSKEKVWRSR
jgi:ribonuclease HII